MTPKHITELLVVFLGVGSRAGFGPSQGGRAAPLLVREDPGQSDFNNAGNQPSGPKQMAFQPDPPIFSFEQPKRT